MKFDVWTRAAPALALLAFVAGLCLVPMSESDLFFRVKVGQEILARGGLLDRNLLSFTYPDFPDLDLAWLFEVTAVLLYRAGGFPALVAAKTVVVVAVFAGAFMLCVRRGAPAAWVALVLAAVALVARDRMVERPHIFSFAGAVAILAIIERLRAERLRAERLRTSPRDGAPRARWALPLAAGLVTALWANLHAGVFIAPLILGAHAAGAFAGRAPHARRALLLTLVSAAAVFATPVGFGVWRYLVLHLQIPRVHPVDEFRPPSWVSDPALVLFGGAVVAALLWTAALAWWRREARAQLLPELAPVLVMAALTATSVRFAPELALVAAPFLVSASVAAARMGEARWPALAAARAALPSAVPVAVVSALLLGAAVGPRVAAARRGEPVLDLGLDEAAVPLDAIRFVEAHGLRERMYNDFEIGSYLAFQGFPRYRVFVDPRLPAYPLDFHRLLGRTQIGPREWTTVLESLGVESALLAYAGVNRRVSWWDPAEWALVYREKDARVFVRRLPKFRALIAELEIPATFEFAFESGNETVPLLTRPAASPVPDCEWRRRLGDLAFAIDPGDTARALAHYRAALAGPAGCLRPKREASINAWLGAADLWEGRTAQALPQLERALELDPEDVNTRTNRALALDALGRRQEAAEEWSRVAERARGTPLGEKARQRAKR